MGKKQDLKIPDIPLDKDRTTQEHVYSRLRHAIMTGAIPPGTSLTMRGLADGLELSPTPIREAVRRLSSEHAIRILENRRMQIPAMTLGRLEELVALRITLETHAAERSLPYISDIFIEKLISIDDAMDRAIAGNDLDRLTILNQDFHRSLYTVNPNQVSMPAIESIWLQLGPFQRQVNEHVKEFYKIDRHKEILEALKARDAAALMAATERDISEGISRSGRQLLIQAASEHQADGTP